MSVVQATRLGHKRSETDKTAMVNRTPHVDLAIDALTQLMGPGSVTGPQITTFYVSSIKENNGLYSI